MSIRNSNLWALLSPTGGRRERLKTADPRVAKQKAQARVDWVRFRRKVRVTPRNDLVRLGTGYGGYVVPSSLVRPDWMCYCAGLGEDISFELDLIRRYGCTVHAFDPVPRSAAYVAPIAKSECGLHFHPYGLWAEDTTLEFFAPADARHVSHSIVNLQAMSESLTAECRSVPSLMRELGHDGVDLIKLDIEGAEYSVLESLGDADLRPTVMLVDFHKLESVDHMAAGVETVAALGLRPVHVHRTDVTFVQADLL